MLNSLSPICINSKFKRKTCLYQINENLFLVTYSFIFPSHIHKICFSSIYKQ